MFAEYFNKSLLQGCSMQVVPREGQPCFSQRSQRSFISCLAGASDPSTTWKQLLALSSHCCLKHCMGLIFSITVYLSANKIYFCGYGTNRSTLYLFIQLIKGGERFGGRENAPSLESSGRQTPGTCMYLTLCR